MRYGRGNRRPATRDHHGTSRHSAVFSSTPAISLELFWYHCRATARRADAFGIYHAARAVSYQGFVIIPGAPAQHDVVFRRARGARRLPAASSASTRLRARPPPVATARFVFACRSDIRMRHMLLSRLRWRCDRRAMISSPVNRCRYFRCKAVSMGHYSADFASHYGFSFIIDRRGAAEARCRASALIPRMPASFVSGN